MSLVTITDHNTIEGALEIAHLPNAFISEEVTTYFPEDGCKIHVLVFNITKKQHQNIQKARPSIFDLVEYLHAEQIAHAVAHPLYSVNDRLTVEHFEKLLLLFKNFEINGARDERQNQTLEQIEALLRPIDIERLAARHGIEPLFPEPWIKNLSGGSDDHSSLNIARTYTEVENAKTVKEFLKGIETNQSRVNRRDSTPLTMAHNLYGIAYQFYKNKFQLDRHVHRDMFLRFLDRFLHGQDGEAGVWSRIYYMMYQRKPSKKANHGGSVQQLLRHEAQKLIWNDPTLMHILKNGNSDGPARQCQALVGGDDIERKWFEFVNRIFNKVMLHFSDNFIDQLSGAHFFNLFSSIGSAGALYSLLAPYFVAFSLFSKDRQLTEKITTRFIPRNSHEQQLQSRFSGIKVAHFTDTFYEVNGVALTLQQQLRLAKKTGKQLTVITCDAHNRREIQGVKIFKPIGVYELPEYPEQKLFYPPFLEMLNYCFEEQFTLIHSATPGPIGLSALAISRILKLPIYGTYHTSLPQYAGYLTDDYAIEELMWKYISWYYEQLDFIYVPSRSTGDELEKKGIPSEKIRLIPRGIDIDRFHPAKRDLQFLKRYIPARQCQAMAGGDDAHLALLYVGRVSKEKNLPLMVEVFKSLTKIMDNVSMIVVGRGPYLKIMQKELKGTPCYFTGYLRGKRLETLYASCDLFVFPSSTDTFGNVVLEAQSSGLPVVVTDSGGPQENMLPGKTGLVVPANDVQDLLKAIRSLLNDPVKLKRMGKDARRYMEGRSFEEAFDKTWKMYQDLSACGHAQAGRDMAFAMPECTLAQAV
jgi:glycosyltransferase involved in cell wall biosynthesis